jgi:hypothetical protein
MGIPTQVSAWRFAAAEAAVGYQGRAGPPLSLRRHRPAQSLPSECTGVPRASGLPVRYYTPSCGPYWQWETGRTAAMNGREHSISPPEPTRSVTPPATTANSNAFSTKFRVQPSRLLARLSHEEQQELIATAVIGADNPWVETAREKLFRNFDFAAVPQDEDSHSSLIKAQLQWLRERFSSRDDEQLIGHALSAWSFSRIERNGDPYLAVQHIVDTVMVHGLSQTGQERDASKLLLMKALQPYIAECPCAEQAALHLLLRIYQTPTLIPVAMEAARDMGLPVVHFLEPAEQAGLLTAPESATTAIATLSVPQPLPALLDAAFEDFDLDRHLTGAKEMTVLDRWLVMATLATATGAPNALSWDEIHELIAELVRLNASRHRTYFMQGFVAALCEESVEMQFAGANEERRSWVLCGGILGTLRSGNSDAVMALIAEHEPVFAQLLRNKRAVAGAWLFEPLYPVLCARGRFDAIGELFANHLVGTSGVTQRRILEQAFADVREFILGSKPEQAVQLLEAIRNGLEQGSRLSIPGRLRDQLFFDAKWRRGQAALALGDFGRAEKYLVELASNSKLSGSTKAKVLADIGLAKAGIRRIHDVFPSADKAKFEAVAASLSKGLDAFWEAVEVDRDAAVRSRLCLAIADMHSGSSQESIAHLRSFLQATLSEPPGYYGIHARAWTRFLLALALVEAGDAADWQAAADHLSDALAEPGFKPPVHMCSRLAGGFAKARLCDSVELLITQIVSSDPLAFAEVVARERLECCSPRARETLLHAAKHASLSTDVRDDYLRRVLDAAVGASDEDALTLLADTIQHLGEADPPNCDRYIDLASEAGRKTADPDWAEVFDEVQIALWKAGGNYQPVYAKLSTRVEELLDSGTANGLDYATNIIDELEGLPASWIKEHVADMRARVALAATPTESHTLSGRLAAMPKPIRIYIVGGCERHRSYEAIIRQQLAAKYPAGKIEVEFLFSGFSSNWMPHVETVKRNIDRFDALVLIYAMRTTFGWWVRKLASEHHKPWSCCGRQGCGAVSNTIMTSVLSVLESRQ